MFPSSSFFLNKLSIVFLAGAQQVQEIFQILLFMAVMFILANKTTTLAFDVYGTVHR
jgi:hypothetical protein